MPEVSRYEHPASLTIRDTTRNFKRDCTRGQLGLRVEERGDVECLE